MKWMLSCKEITEICCDESRKLSLIEKVKFWMHIGMCKVCAAYKNQMEFIRNAMKKIMHERSLVDENKVTILEKEIIKKESKGA